MPQVETSTDRAEVRPFRGPQQKHAPFGEAPVARVCADPPFVDAQFRFFTSFAWPWPSLVAGSLPGPPPKSEEPMSITE